MEELKPCPICKGKTIWCDEKPHDDEDDHKCHYIVCIGKCKCLFDMAGDNNPDTLDELKAICAASFNDRA